MSDLKECWSTNNEDFPANSLSELLSSHDELRVGDTVYVGEPVKPKPSSFFDIEDFIEGIGNAAYDVGGEYADGYPDVTEGAKAELQSFVETWLETHCEVNFYQVFNAREYVITEEDLL